MGKKLYEEASVQAIAEAIRAKNGSTATYKIAEMAQAVRGIEGLKTTVTEYSQLNDTAAAYLAAAEAAYTDTNGDTVSVIADYATNSGNKDWPQGLTLPAQSGTRYMLDETDGTGGSIVNQVGSSSVIYNTVPGHPVQYFVKNSSGGVVGSGRVKSTGQLRMLRFSGYVKNCRDLGGWACDGGTVRYGLLYRCAAPGASLESVDRSYAQLVNIRYQIDVRDSTAFTASPFGSRVYYRFCPMTEGYVAAVKPDGVDYAMTKTVLRAIFDAAVHGDGSIFHCALGRDRTGTIAFLLLALLGVARRHIDMDYELSGFSSVSGSGAMKRTNSAYLGLANYIMGQGKTTLRDNAVMWAVKAGFTVDEINAFRAAVIDGTPPVLAAGDYQIAYTLTQNLTNCTSSVTAATVYEYEALSITLTPGSGYKLGSVTVTMAGTDITASVVSGATISIPAVRGNVVITAVAVPAYTNVIPQSINADGTPFNNGKGWLHGYMIEVTDGSLRENSSWNITGYIPVTQSDTFRIKNYGFSTPATAYDNISFYDSSFGFLGVFTSSSPKNPLSQFIADGMMTACIATAGSTNFDAAKKASIAYMRLSFDTITNDTIVTINEEIK